MLSNRSAAVFWGCLSRLNAAKQREFEPLPVAVHVGEADLPQPAELRLHVEQAIRGVFLFRGTPSASRKRSCRRCVGEEM